MNRPFKKLFDFFFLTRRQRKGMTVLFVLLVVMVMIYAGLPFIASDREEDGDQFFVAEVQEYLSAQPKAETPKMLTPFPFDPNTITEKQLMELGLSQRQASMISKYRNAGGTFRDNEDFGKIYSISDEEYAILAPYIVIAKQPGAESESKPPPGPAYQPFPFDPNHVDSTELAAMGLGSPQISNIMNYRKAGGTFRLKQDFKKLYTISEEIYAIFEKNILLPSADTIKTLIADEQPEPLIMVELNSADTAQLQNLRGIGPILAKRIVDYRQKLGGFYDKVQLLEVFGIDTTRFHGFADQVEVDRTKIIKTDINTAGFSDLLKNPYVEYYIVQSIFGYKDAIGRFDSVAQLRNIDLIYDQLYHKLEPYLIVDNTLE